MSWLFTMHQGQPVKPGLPLCEAGELTATFGLAVKGRRGVAREHRLNCRKEDDATASLRGNSFGSCRRTHRVWVEWATRGAN